MNDLRQRTFWTLLQNAVLSPLSAVVIAIAILLIGMNVRVPVLNLSSTAWLMGLVPLWLVVVVGNVISKSAGEMAVTQVLREQYDINQISNTHLRTVVAQSLAYRERIDNTIKQTTAPVMRERLQDVSSQVEDWIRRIYTLARRLDVYRNDSIIASDLSSVPLSIQQLQSRLKSEDDSSVKGELDNTIVKRQAQLATLKNLDSSMERAELQLENTLTSLGTVYSQILLLDARDVDSAKTQRLRENITEQVRSLQDLQTSLDEVYGTNGDSPLKKSVRQ